MYKVKIFIELERRKSGKNLNGLGLTVAAADESDAKSLYISRVASNFYGTEIEIWAGFGPVGNTEKKNWADYEQLLRAVFSCFQEQKKN